MYKAKPVRETKPVCEANLVNEIKLVREAKSKSQPRVEALGHESNEQYCAKHFKFNTGHQINPLPNKT